MKKFKQKYEKKNLNKQKQLRTKQKDHKQNKQNQRKTLTLLRPQNKTRNTEQENTNKLIQKNFLNPYDI